MGEICPPTGEVKRDIPFDSSGFLEGSLFFRETFDALNSATDRVSRMNDSISSERWEWTVDAFFDLSSNMKPKINNSRHDQRGSREAIIKVDNNQDAAEAARQFDMIFKNADYSEMEKRHRALALGSSVNDDDESSVKSEFELQNDAQDQIQRRYKRQPRL